MTIIGRGLSRKHCLSYIALALSLFMHKDNSLHTWTVSASQWAVLIRWWLGFILVLVSFTLYRYEEMHATKASILIIFQFNWNKGTSTACTSLHSRFLDQGKLILLDIDFKLIYLVVPCQRYYRKMKKKNRTKNKLSFHGINSCQMKMIEHIL